MKEYEAPAIVEVGSLADVTLTNIVKTAGSGDTITIAGDTEPAPGGGVISLS